MLTKISLTDINSRLKNSARFCYLKTTVRSAIGKNSGLTFLILRNLRFDLIFLKLAILPLCNARRRISPQVTPIRSICRNGCQLQPICLPQNYTPICVS